VAGEEIRVGGDRAREHRKQIWIKEAWEPPGDVFADAKANDSVLYPYTMVVEFSLKMTSGPERDTKAEAENDTNLSPIPYMPDARYRNVYLVGKDTVRLKRREVLSQERTSSGLWQERPAWPNACWDHIAEN
jgi:hypothetical protein